MYEPLTKVITIGEQEVIVCRNYGTEMCHIHNPRDGVSGCQVCSMFAAMLNQLHAFEQIILEGSK